MGKQIIIGGDFNICMDPILDKKGRCIETYCKSANMLKSLMTELNLCDIYRIQHPSLKRFTWRNKGRAGWVQSRLDMFLVSEDMHYNNIKSYIHPSIKSDHSLIHISFKSTQQWSRGRGFYKFNTKLLEDTDYVEKMNAKLSSLYEESRDFTNKALFLDYLKCEIRGFSISYSAYKAKQNKQKESLLKAKLAELEHTVSETPTPDTIDKYYNIKSELETLYVERSRGSMIRSRVQYINENENATKFFLNLEKQNYNKKCIKMLITENREEITDEKEILNEQKNYYKNLYSDYIPNISNDDLVEMEQDFLESADMKKLNVEQKDFIDSEMTIEECGKALSQLSNNKSPGCDGLPTEFYKFFWGHLKYIVYDSFKWSIENNSLSVDQKRGVITLVPKQGKDVRHLSNWRPISVLNTDYKILTKLYALRLQTVLGDIINPDQVGYLKGRFIGENIRTIKDIMDYTQHFKISGLIALMDFQKAFDTVSWSFLIKCLNSFNFGDKFISIVKMLYSDIESCVTNNGKSSTFFRLHRGIRQGCCLSALLFIIVVELLAISIRASNDIKGLTINNFTYKISQLADDTTLFIKDQSSLKYAFDLIERFGFCSGLKLNKSKTELIALDDNIKRDKNLHVTWNNGPFKTLGVWFTNSEEETYNLNFRDKLPKLRQILSIWSGQSLSLKGKITIIKNLVISKIINTCSMMYIPINFIKEVDKLVFTFLWGEGKRPKVRKSVIVNDYSSGGLKMVDFLNTIKSLKAVWVQRILLCESKCMNNKWANIATAMIGSCNQKLLLHKQNFEDLKLPPWCNNFYKQVLECWYNFFSKEPETYLEIIQEKFQYNRFLKIGEKQLDNSFDFLKKHNILRVVDIIEGNNFMTKVELETKLACSISALFYNSLVCAIPQRWKLLIRSNKKPNNYLKHDISHLKKNIAQLKTRDIYCYLTYTKNLPTSVNKWIEHYPFLETLDWTQLFRVPYQITKEPKLQSFQYCITNRFVNCNYNLFLWRQIDSELCDICHQIDTIEHFFYYCSVVNNFWIHVGNLIFEAFEIKLEYTVLEILLGIPCKKNTVMSIINFVILYAKRYIYCCRIHQRNLSINYFTGILKNRVKTEVYICKMSSENNGNVSNHWNVLLAKCS